MTTKSRSYLQRPEGKTGLILPVLILAPHQNRPSLRIDDHVEAVIRAIVDDEIQVERARDAPA